MAFLAILIDVSLGMQSLRQMLVMNILFILIEGLQIIRNKKVEKNGKNKQTLFVVILFIANAFGIIASKMLHINQKTIIDNIVLY